MGVLSACIAVHCLCAWWLQSPEEGTGSAGLRLHMIVSYHVGVGPMCLNLGPLEEQAVLCPAPTSLFLSSSHSLFPTSPLSTFMSVSLFPSPPPPLSLHDPVSPIKLAYRGICKMSLQRHRQLTNVYITEGNLVLSFSFILMLLLPIIFSL